MYAWGNNCGGVEKSFLISKIPWAILIQKLASTEVYKGSLMQKKKKKNVSSSVHWTKKAQSTLFKITLESQDNMNNQQRQSYDWADV